MPCDHERVGEPVVEAAHRARHAQRACELPVGAVEADAEQHEHRRDQMHGHRPASDRDDGLDVPCGQHVADERLRHPRGGAPAGEQRAERDVVRVQAEVVEAQRKDQLDEAVGERPVEK